VRVKNNKGIFSVELVISVRGLSEKPESLYALGFWKRRVRTIDKSVFSIIEGFHQQGLIKKERGG